MFVASFSDSLSSVVTKDLDVRHEYGDPEVH